MRKRTVILLILVLIVAALAVTAAMAFRTKPVLDPGGTHSILFFTVWKDGPDLSKSRVNFGANQEQATAFFDALADHERKLSTERLGSWLMRQALPVQYRFMEPELPAWLEVNVVLWDEDTQRFHNLLLGDGHAQLRAGDAYDPPYYEIDGAEELYTDLMDALQIDYIRTHDWTQP